MLDRRRFIVEETLLVTHQTVVYATDEANALARWAMGDVEDEPKPYYLAPEGAELGALKVYEGSEQ
jgi:hypothetical protein